MLTEYLLNITSKIGSKIGSLATITKYFEIDQWDLQFGNDLLLINRRLKLGNGRPNLAISRIGEREVPDLSFCSVRIRNIYLSHSTIEDGHYRNTFFSLEFSILELGRRDGFVQALKTNQDTLMVGVRTRNVGLGYEAEFFEFFELNLN